MKGQRRFNTILFSLLILLVAVGALAFRLPRLEQRPMHTDEAVHAVKLGVLLEKGVYEYDPQEYHGPTLYYFSLPFVWLSGARTYAEIPNEVPLRIAPVVFGAGLILLLLLMRDGLGRGAVVCAAVLTAVSPAMVFYSRYYIQEILLVFFTFAAMGAAWRYTRTKKLAWALLSGACVGLMYASKETFVIACLAMLGGAALAAAWTRRVDHDELRLRDYVDRRHAAGAIVVAVIVGVLCLTVFMTQPRAIWDSLLSYSQYIQRAGTGDSSTSGAGLHNHPWYYYLKMLAFAKYAPGPWWSEGLIMALALVGIAYALRKQGQSRETVPVFQRFLAFYTILMTVVYSIAPYKTPWCMLSFLHGMILMAGVGAVALYRLLPGKPLKAIVGALLVLGVWHLGAQAHRGNDVFDSDPRNPYVYAQTSGTFLRLPKRAEQIADVHPDGHDMLVKVIVPGSDYWPLPWYLRQFTSVGYWNEPPDDPDAAMIITTPALETDLDAALRDSYQKEYFGLRPDVLLLAYVRADLWEEFIERMEQ